MINTEKVINVIDAICDCTPFLSTVTNGIQLLYKLARKVDATANPVNTSWKTDLKIRVITKNNFHCMFGAIPFVGNLGYFVYYVLAGIKDPLMNAVTTRNYEAIQLYIKRHPLKERTEEKARKILEEAVNHSKPEIFQCIFDSRAWNIDSLIGALDSCWFGNKLQNSNVNYLLDYYNNNQSTLPIKKEHIPKIVHAFENFVRGNRPETADRILSLLPECCEFSDVKEILAKCAYHPSGETSRPATDNGVLTDDQIDKLIKRCHSMTKDGIDKYKDMVSNERISLKAKVDQINAYNQKHYPKEQLLDKDKLLKDFDTIHKGIIERLQKRTNDIQDDSTK